MFGLYMWEDQLDLTVDVAPEGFLSFQTIVKARENEPFPTLMYWNAARPDAKVPFDPCQPFRFPDSENGRATSGRPIANNFSGKSEEPDSNSWSLVPTNTNGNPPRRVYS